MKLIASILFSFVSLIAVSQSNLTIFNNGGQQFYAILNGIKQNSQPQTNVYISGIKNGGYSLKIIFADGKTADVDKNLFIDAPSDITTRIIFKKGKGKLQLVSLEATEGVITPGAVVYRPSDASVYTDAVVQTTTVQTTTTQTTNGSTNTNTQAPINGNLNVNANGMNQQTNQTGNVGVNVNMNASGMTQTQSNQNGNANFNMNVSGNGIDPNMQNGNVGISINVSGMDPNMQNGNMGLNMNVNATGMEQQQVNPNANLNLNMNVNATGMNQTMTPSNNANMNMNVNANGMQTQNTNGNIQMNVNSNGLNTQQNSGQTTITTTTTTTTTNSGGNVNYQATNQQNQVNTQSNVNTSGALIACNRTLNNLPTFLEELKDQSFEDDRVESVKLALKNTCLTTDQAGKIIELFTFDANRLEIAKFLSDRLIDRENATALAKLMTFDSSKMEYRKYVASH